MAALGAGTPDSESGSYFPVMLQASSQAPYFSESPFPYVKNTGNSSLQGLLEMKNEMKYRVGVQ